MKAILNKINKLEIQIESGLLSKSEAMQQLRQLRCLVTDKYDEGSDTFTNLIHSLIDCNSLIEDTY